jgi:hypothetical protein
VASRALSMAAFEAVSLATAACFFAGSDGARARLGSASVEDHVLHSELACPGGIMMKKNISRPAPGL